MNCRWNGFNTETGRHQISSVVFAAEAAYIARFWFSVNVAIAPVAIPLHAAGGLPTPLLLGAASVTILFPVLLVLGYMYAALKDVSWREFSALFRHHLKS